MSLRTSATSSKDGVKIDKTRELDKLNPHLTALGHTQVEEQATAQEVGREAQLLIKLIMLILVLLL
jgi:hypothetical protein